jgi:hypothetical protein
VNQARRVDARARDLRLAFGSRQRCPDVDEVVSEDAEPDPSLHAGVTFVATARESVAALQQTDPTGAIGVPACVRSRAARPMGGIVNGWRSCWNAACCAGVSCRRRPCAICATSEGVGEAPSDRPSARPISRARALFRAPGARASRGGRGRRPASRRAASGSSGDG